jgi:hypothetical protein
MAETPSPNPSALSGRSASSESAHLEGARVVSADYGAPGSKGMGSPLKPLLWLLVPFFFCLTYGIITR